jgi:hypothetical protein
MPPVFSQPHNLGQRLQTGKRVFDANRKKTKLAIRLRAGTTANVSVSLRGLFEFQRKNRTSKTGSAFKLKGLTKKSSFAFAKADPMRPAPAGRMWMAPEHRCKTGMCTYWNLCK